MELAHPVAVVVGANVSDDDSAVVLGEPEERNSTLLVSLVRVLAPKSKI